MGRPRCPVTDVRRTDTGWLALYDGRASAAEELPRNGPGVAVGDSHDLTYAGGPPQRPALRYANIIGRDVRARLPRETATEDGCITS